jgi:hypothetical protein
MEAGRHERAQTKPNESYPLLVMVHEIGSVFHGALVIKDEIIHTKLSLLISFTVASVRSGISL